jgi:O-antigen/teichoic acid export membrane protein
MTSLKKLAVKGAAWTLLGYGANQVLRFGGNIVLTRLLKPEMFGLIALVNVFLTGLQLFSDIGIRPSIIQNKRGEDPAFLNTAWTIQVMRGFGLWSISLLMAAPVAKFYEKPQLLWLVPLIGLTAIVAGFNSTSIASLNRKLELGKLTMLDLLAYAVQLIVMIVWAWFSPTIWSLIIGFFVAAFLKLARSHALNTGTPNYFTWDSDAVKELFSFGKWIFLSTAVTFLAMQSDRLILGKLISLETLGVYTVAYTLADIPRQISMKLGSSVIFPLLSQKKSLPRPVLRTKILQKRRLLLVVLAIGLSFLVSFGDFLVARLYDDRYVQATWMVPILAAGLWHTLLYNTMSSSLMALGKPFYIARATMLHLFVLSVGLPLGFSLMGLLGALIVVAFSDVPKYLVMMYGLWREGLSCIQEDLKLTLLFVGFVSLILFVRTQLGLGLPIAGALG